MSANHATSAYSALSVILQLECKIEKLLDVPPESFQPPPKVDSAVVQLKQKTELPIATSQLPDFRKFVHKCFQQRRKTLRNNLKGLLEVDQIESLGIDPQLRPEHLQLEQYITLFALYTVTEKLYDTTLDVTAVDTQITSEIQQHNGNAE
jgi:16S rRNA (adenine1518-N6/adenine1519-N6)-dimethyltransferase